MALFRAGAGTCVAIEVVVFPRYFSQDFKERASFRSQGKCGSNRMSKLGLKVVFGAATIAGMSVGCVLPSYAEDQNAQKTYQKTYQKVAQSVQMAASNNVEGAAVNLGQAAIEYFLPAIGEELPQWAQRIEFEAEIQDDGKPYWSLLTVQPLYESEGKEQTVFTQLSQNRYEYLGTDRDVTNIGLGYRQLLNDNTIMLGANTFFDWEWKRRHKRLGMGVEAKWSGLDFASNAYWGLGGATGSGLSGDTREEVLDGYDVELGLQIPYMPWARVYGKRYFWESVLNTEDIKGWTASLEADIHQNLTVEAGWRDDNFSDDEVFMKLSFNFGPGGGQPNRPAAFSSSFIADQAWDMRDMSEHNLDKVRRENRIIVERRSSGVVISRSN